jgi:hypothetical protein
MNPNPTSPNPAEQEGTTPHTAEPPHDLVTGLPRLVIESHTRLGPNATPERVVEDLRAIGVETTVEEVRGLWPEGGMMTG